MIKLDDEKAVIKILRDIEEPIKFLQKYIEENHCEDMTIIIGHDRAKLLHDTYVLFFTKDSVERRQAWEQFLEKGFIN